MPSLGRRPASASVTALEVAGSLALIGLEHRASDTFSERVRSDLGQDDKVFAETYHHR